MMKTFKSIFIIIIVLGVVVSILGYMKRNSAPVVEVPNVPEASEEIDLSPEVDAIQVCYMWNTEAGDKAMISMDVRGNDVIGEFYWLPAQKDKKTGIFKGKITTAYPINPWSVMNGWWEANAEGTKVTEELVVRIEGDYVNPGFGEMKDRGDGIYVYANPAQINYSLVLNQTDCGDDAMD